MDNCYKLWTIKKEEVLIDLYKRNLKIYEISNILQRTSGAINSRLKKLNLKNSTSNHSLPYITVKLENDIEYILDELKKIHLILDKIQTDKISNYIEI